jgi:hypothetical protein
LGNLFQIYFYLKKFSFIYLRIHVRRTDKVGNEASFHDISEYMKYVEDYYIIYQYQNPNSKFIKRVYIATDEPSIFQDARTKYKLFLKRNILLLFIYLFILKDIQIIYFMVMQLLHNLLNLIQDMEQNH